MDRKILDGYNSPDGAARYAGKFKRHWTERMNNWHERRLVHHLLRKTSNGKPVGLALDLPCGYGRLHPTVQEFAERVVESDWSFHMLLSAREQQQERNSCKPKTNYVRATVFSLPFPDSAFELVLSVRLCHHIREHGERLHYVQEITRVSSQWVIFTYFDRDSIKNRLREWRRRFGKKRSKWTLSSSEILRLAEKAGFDVVYSIPLSRLFSGHRYVVLRRRMFADLQ
jgi:SAM-dependent methyltransferase